MVKTMGEITGPQTFQGCAPLILSARSHGLEVRMQTGVKRPRMGLQLGVGLVLGVGMELQTGAEAGGRAGLGGTPSLSPMGSGPGPAMPPSNSPLCPSRGGAHPTVWGHLG